MKCLEPTNQNTMKANQIRLWGYKTLGTSEMYSLMSPPSLIIFHFPIGGQVSQDAMNKYKLLFELGKWIWVSSILLPVTRSG